MSARKLLYGFGILWFPLLGHSQELYVFSDPASNIPARSLSAKMKSHGVGADQIYGRFTYRVMPQLMAGVTGFAVAVTLILATAIPVEAGRGACAMDIDAPIAACRQE